MAETVDYLKFFEQDRFASLTGAQLVEVLPGYAKARLTVETKHLNAGNVVQGGVLFTLADFAMAAAANANGRLAFSIQSDIRFLQSAVTGDKLCAEAREVLLKKLICHYHVDIKNEKGDLIAVFDGICYRK